MSSNRQLLMTTLSVTFKATLRAINTIKFQIYDLLQLYVKQNKIIKKKKKKKGTELFPNDLPVNALTHLCMNGFNFCAITGWEIQKSRELMFLILDPKLRKFEIKRKNDKINILFLHVR